MNRLYIIEGQDRCGKTTLVNKLRQRITNPKIITIHSGKPPTGVNPETWSKQHYKNLYKTVDLLLIDGYDIILDRSWIGEFVYGPMYRDTNLTEKDLIGFMGLPQEQVVLRVLVDDAVNIASRSDGESISDDLYLLSKERELFIEALSKTDIDTKLIYDWHYDEFSDKQLENIIDDMLGEH